MCAIIKTGAPVNTAGRSDTSIQPIQPRSYADDSAPYIYDTVVQGPAERISA
jgi:hypothetical protein